MVAAVFEDILGRPPDVRFSHDHRRAATLRGDHRSLHADPFLITVRAPPLKAFFTS
jgi:hypothetical protein